MELANGNAHTLAHRRCLVGGCKCGAACVPRKPRTLRRKDQVGAAVRRWRFGYNGRREQ